MWRSDLMAKFLEKVPHGGCIADVGCGRGSDTEYFLAAGRSVLALDRCCNLIANIPCHPNVRAVCADLETYDLKRDAFAGIWACGVLCFLPSELFRVVLHRLWLSLQKSGILALTMPMGVSKRPIGPRRLLGMTEAELRQIFVGLGPSSMETQIIWRQRNLSRFRWLVAVIEK